jgi:hypothetical protein
MSIDFLAEPITRAKKAAERGMTAIFLAWTLWP